MSRHPLSTLFVHILTALFCVGIALPAFAGEPTDFVQKKTGKVTKLLQRKDNKRRAEKLDEILQATVDFEELAARSLGEYWKERSEEEQQEFLSLLQQMLRANYSKKLSGKKLGKDYEISYKDEKTRDTLAIVKTVVQTKEETKPVSYKLIKREEGWIVFDIVIDDISLEETYRESYTEIIRTDGWDALIQAMRDKIKELESA